MITSFKHPDLKVLCGQDRSAGNLAGHGAVLIRILSALDQATIPGEMDLPGFRFRELKGPLKAHYAVSGSESLSVTFRFENGQVADVDLTEHPDGA